MAHDPAVFAEMVTLTIKAALAPILERVAEQSAQVKQALAVEAVVTSLRERLVVLETKAAAPPVVVPEPQDLTPVLERMAGLDVRVASLFGWHDRDELTLSELHDKCVTLETKAAIPPQVPAPPDLDPILLHRVDLLEVGAASIRDLFLKLEAKVAQPHDVVPSGPSAAELELLIRNTMEPVKAAVAVALERLAAAEARAGVPGPVGKDGKDGAPGLDGKDGVDGMTLDDLAIVQHEDERTITIRGTVGGRTKDIGSLTLPSPIHRAIWVAGKTYDRGDIVAYDNAWWNANETTTNKPGDGTKAWTMTLRRPRDGKDGKDAEVVPVVSLGSGRR